MTVAMMAVWLVMRRSAMRMTVMPAEHDKSEDVDHESTGAPPEDELWLRHRLAFNDSFDRIQ